MGRKMIHYLNEVPLFHGKDYEDWSRKMKSHLTAMGVGIWKSVLIDYDVLDTPPFDQHERKKYE